MSKTNQQTLYKVVTGDLESVAMSYYAVSPFVVRYSETNFVGGVNGSKVFCFTSLEAARKFKHSFCTLDGRIYQVEVRGVKVYPKQIGLLNVQDILHFWKMRRFTRSTSYSGGVISGTVLVDKVRLAKRVY